MADSEIARSMFVFQNTAAAVAETKAEARPEVHPVERFIAGDRRAFDELYKMYAPMVHGIVLLKVPFSEAQDIVQEVFLLAYQNLGGLREAKAFGGWLARIARNRAAEFYRSRRPTEELPEEVVAGEKPSAEALEILEAIRGLPETYRETLVLRLVEGMTGTEIAERIGMTHESVRVNLHRGMEMLRRKLGVEVKRK